MYRNVSPGPWTVIAQMMGFQLDHQEILLTQESDIEHNIRLSHDLTLKEALTVSDGDPSLTYSRYVVSGVVIDVNGRPIAGATARLQGTTTFVMSSEAQGCTTDELGRYFLSAWSPKLEHWTLSVAAESHVAYSLIDLELVPDELRIVDIRLR